MIGKIITLILPFLASTPIAEKEVKHMDTNQVYKLIDKAHKKIELGQKDSAEYYFKQAGSFAKNINFTNGFLKYTGDYTNFLYKELRYKDGLKIAEQQLEKSRSVGNTKTLANAYNNIGLLYYSMSEMTKAANFYIRALKTSEKSNDLYNQRKYNTNLASLFIDIKDYNKGLYYAKNGYKIAVKLKDSTSIARSLTNLIVVEVFKEQFEQAKAHSLQLIKICEKNQYFDLLAIGYINLGDIYHRQQQYNNAIKTLLLAEAKLKYAPLGYDAYVYHGLANAFKELKNYNKASSYFEKCMINAEEAMPLADLKAVYLLGAELKEQTNSLKQALAFRKKFEKANDSLSSQTNHQIITEIETKYQTSLKEQKITEQKLQIANNKNELSKKNNLILIAVFIIFVLSTAAIIGFILNKQRNRALVMQQEVKLLAALLAGEERERTRTAKDLHDAVASTLSAAKIQISHQSGLSTPYIEHSREKAVDLIEAALKEVRNISHNLAPNMVLDEGLAYATANFCHKVSTESLQINSYFIGNIPNLEPEKSLIIYRIIQEAINNVIKHANASEALVQLIVNDGQLDITIEDNGKGFEPKKVKKNGIGIANLTNRIQLLNGTYEISSSPNEGTTLYINIPLKSVLDETTHRPVTYA